MPNESWKWISGYEGEYQISNYGRVKSFKFGRTPIRRPSLHNGGYLRVILSKNNITKCRFIHILVAQHFIPNPENKHHIDGFKFNNFVGNLEWATPVENSQHSLKMGLKTIQYGEECANAKLTGEQVRYIRDVMWHVVKLIKMLSKTLTIPAKNRKLTAEV